MRPAGLGGGVVGGGTLRRTPVAGRSTSAPVPIGTTRRRTTISDRMAGRICAPAGGGNAEGFGKNDPELVSSSSSGSEREALFAYVNQNHREPKHARHRSPHQSRLGGESFLS
jgi:hypothetical protein